MSSPSTSNPWARVRTATTTIKSSNRLGASLITPQLYLSDYLTAHDSSELSRLGITHVISVLEFDVHIPDSIPEENKMHIRIADRPESDILIHLERTTEFIRAAVEDKNNRVLVHCFQGVSRSATVVCAYLVATSGMRATQSIGFVQSKRKIVCPNNGFRQQLEMYSNYSAFMGPPKKHVVSEGITEKIRRSSSENRKF
ncbi:phosphatases II [Marasmius fiardii PR-910]|nr:phosphatases II [Marasmius fiardii PR-910]